MADKNLDAVFRGIAEGERIHISNKCLGMGFQGNSQLQPARWAGRMHPQPSDNALPVFLCRRGQPGTGWVGDRHPTASPLRSSPFQSDAKITKGRHEAKTHTHSGRQAGARAAQRPIRIQEKQKKTTKRTRRIDAQLRGDSVHGHRRKSADGEPQSVEPLDRRGGRFSDRSCRNGTAAAVWGRRSEQLRDEW